MKKMLASFTVTIGRIAATTGRRLILLPAVAAAAVSLLASGAGSGVTADEAIKKLKEGNERFVKGTQTHAGTDQARRTETFAGQKPYVTILGCSDSREPLEHIFDAGIGELFVIRVAGNVADTDEIGSIEYGVDHLMTPVLLVLGHTKCGAVTAVASGDEVHGHIPMLVDNIIAPVNAAKKKMGSGAAKNDIVKTAINENIYQSMADIIAKSPLVAKRIKSGQVKVMGALYHLDSGAVEWMGEHPSQAALVDAGLKADPHGAHLNPIAGSLGATGILILFMLLAMKLFITEKRVFSNMKFKGRLTASFILTIAALSAALIFIYGFSGAHGVTGYLIGGLPVLAALMISYIIAGIHLSAFKKFYTDKINQVKVISDPDKRS